MTSTYHRPDPLRGAVAGLAAGLLASLAMTGAQAVLAKLIPDAAGGSGSATEKAADRISEAATGAPVPDDRKAAAGEAVHYAFGALLGLGYGLAAETSDAVVAGGGTVFGTTVAILADDVAVPALGLAPPPQDTPAPTHVYAVASHLVFGLVLEATRRLLRG